jgi:proliferating cell nuclear antigen
MTENNRLFSFTTVQTNAIKILFEALKNILCDVNFTANSYGIKLTTIDSTKCAIVNLFLYAEKFEEYICDGELNIGLNLVSIFKILKGSKNADTISFYIYKNEPTVLNIKTVSSNKKTSIESKVKILDMDEKIYNIPDISFDSYITMPSSDFQTYISELSNVSDEIHFKSNSKELILSAKGDFAEQKIRINESNDSLVNDDKYQSGCFNVKYILLFCKSSNLCSTIEIYLKTDYPLTILYNIANLGKIKYCLAPKNINV